MARRQFAFGVRVGFGVAIGNRALAGQLGVLFNDNRWKTYWRGWLVRCVKFCTVSQLETLNLHRWGLPRTKKPRREHSDGANSEYHLETKLQVMTALLRVFADFLLNSSSKLKRVFESGKITS
jgi:hypothetical protein